MTTRFRILRLTALLSTLALLFWLATETARIQHTDYNSGGSSHDDVIIPCEWGVFRPFPYVGLRCKSLSSPRIGLMWYKPSLLNGYYTSCDVKHNWNDILRHECAYSDGLTKFGWTRHNGKDFGQQTIVDPTNRVELAVDWVQLDPWWWTIRISSVQYEASTNTQLSTEDDSGAGSICNAIQDDLSVLVYLGTPGNSTATFNTTTGRIEGIQSMEDTSGAYYEMYVENAVHNNSHPSYHNTQTNSSVKYDAMPYFMALQVEEKGFYNPKGNVVSELQDPTSSLPPHLFDPKSLYRAETVQTGNQIVLQVFYSGTFTIDVHFKYERPPHLEAIGSSDSNKEQDVVGQTIAIKSRNFDASFQQRFQTQNWTDAQLETAHYALGNMLGSLTYMDGDQQLISRDDGVISIPSPAPLLAVVPDRPNHAQGFLWDEGFHQHLIHRWDVNLSMSIVESWFVQIDADGWIARQQMLGDEIRWSARPTSWPQVPGTANPPSLHLFLEALLNSYSTTTKNSLLSTEQDTELPEFIIRFLERIWYAFHSHVDWYLRTQQSPLSPTLFRWQGRTPSYCLPSGMDDYPRAPILTTQEAHLDLQTWMIMSTRVASRVANVLGRIDESKHYAELSVSYRQSMEEHFWNPDQEIYDEFYYPTTNGTKTWNHHFGYLNFWPFFLDAMDTTSIRFRCVTLKLLDRTNGIWSKYGLRSLSAHDPYFQKGDNYWTGPIWLNVNYLILAALHRFSTQPLQYPMDDDLRKRIHEDYKELRQNIVDMIVQNYSDRGFIWEVYSGNTGEGFNNHPFTGWSALVVNILAETY